MTTGQKQEKPVKPKPVVRPESTLTAIDDGGTVHRNDGSDPWPGVCVAEAGMTWHKFAGGCLEAFGVMVIMLIVLLAIVERCSG